MKKILFLLAITSLSKAQVFHTIDPIYFCNDSSNNYVTHFFKSFSQTPFLKIDESLKGSFECWEESEGNVLSHYQIFGQKDVPKTASCYRIIGSNNIFVVDTVTTIRLLYLDNLQKQKELEKMDKQRDELLEIISSVWYYDSPENKKFEAKLRAYGKKYNRKFNKVTKYKQN